MKLKTAITSVLCVVLTLTLTACGNSASNNAGVDLPVVYDIEYDIPNGTQVKISNGQGSYLPADKYFEFADSDLLAGSAFSANVAVIGTSTKMIDTDTGVHLKIKGQQEGITAQAKLCGISDNAILTDFIDGKRKIVEGRLFETLNECVISKDLADYSELSVGDTLTFENTTLGTDGNKILYELTVVGVYSDSTKEYDSWYKVAYLNRRNEVLTTMDTVLSAADDDDRAGIMMEAQYYLKDGFSVSDFEKELRDKGLPSGFRVSKE